MSWEARRKNNYYYRTRREGGRVVRDYVGAGPVAELAASADAHRRAARQAERVACQRAQLELEPILAACQSVHEMGQEIVRTALEAAGFHRRNYGAWRKKRMIAHKLANNQSVKKGGPQAPPKNGTPHDALQRAHDGDASAMPEVRKYLDSHPAVWRKYGDMTARTLSRMIGQLTGHDLVQQESLARQLNELKAELSGGAPSGLEKLVIDRILVGWLQVHYLDIAIMTMQQGGMKFTEHLLKWQQSANRQYMAAMRELTVIRRLLPAGDAASPQPVVETQRIVEPMPEAPTFTVVEPDQPELEPKPTVAPRCSDPDEPSRPSQTPSRESHFSTSAPRPRLATPPRFVTELDEDDVPVIGIRLLPPTPKWISECEQEDM